MSGIGIIGILLVIANVAFSYKGLTSVLFFERYKFEVDKILINKDYKRLVTSGFLHVSWAHLIFNMLSLLAFSGLIESYLGGLQFVIIYIGSLLGGDLLSLVIHRQHGNYASVGASGAVCGIIFASIVLFPGTGIGFFGIPFSIPGWLYGILFVLYSVYGIRSKKNNIGHEAHLGGALIGMVIAIILNPSALADNFITILLITIPTIAFIYSIVTKPQILLIDNYFYKASRSYSIDDRYNLEKNKRQKEIDKLLDKIHHKGIQNLSKKEREQLDEYSKSSR